MKPKLCPKCMITHEKTGTFCSRACANSRNFSEESRRLKSQSAKNSIKVKEANMRIGKSLQKRILKNCHICNNSYYSLPSRDRKTCSNVACRTAHSKIVCGGYRERSGRSNSGYYDGMYCGSTYELLWMMYNMHHNISFERYQGFIIYGNGKKYFPDFIKDGEIIEIKGYHVPSVDDKVRAVQKLGKKISVLYKDDLAAQFTWFKSNFPNKKLEECFDDFSPKFKYVCPICSIEFYRNKKGRSPKTFCSRTCSAKNANMVLYAGAAPALLP